MRRQLLPALLAFVAFTVVLGILYPLAITGIAQVGFSAKANGSLVERDGVVVGSSLIGQGFTAADVLPPAALRRGRRVRRDVERGLEPRPLESGARQGRRRAHRSRTGTRTGSPPARRFPWKP